MKEACTDSDEGREVVRFLDPWFRSEAGRFHRAFALMLVVLSIAVATLGLARNHEPGEAILLAAFLGIGGVMAVRLAAPFGLPISPASRSSAAGRRPLQGPPLR